MTIKIFFGKVQNGVIEVPLEDAGENISLQKIYFEDLGIIFDGEDTAQLKNYANFVVWLIALDAILIILILSWCLQRKSYSAVNGVASTMTIESEKNFKPVANFSYHGKLIITAPNDENFETREFNLFRIATEQISLSEILEFCNIERFSEFAGIVIKPAAQGILLENNSECAITKNNELIERGKSIELFYNESVNISADYGTATLILTFENLNPN